MAHTQHIALNLQRGVPDCRVVVRVFSKGRTKDLASCALRRDSH